MKKTPWIAFCVAVLLAGLTGQMPAFCQTTNAFYDLSCTSTLKVSKFHASQTTSETCALLSDGTYDLEDGSNHFTGTFTVAKSGKQIALTLDANGLATFKSNVVAAIETEIDDPTLTVTITHVTIGKVLIKGGVPALEMITVTGKGSITGTVHGHTKTVSRGFNIKQVRTGWTLESGTNP